MKTRLTDAVVARLKAPATGQVDYWDAAHPNFGVRVSSRCKTYMVMSRINGRKVRRTVGRADVLSYSQAWAKARQILTDPRPDQGTKNGDRMSEAYIVYEYSHKAAVAAFPTRSLAEEYASTCRAEMEDPGVIYEVLKGDPREVEE